jgi:2-dehydropantoate 2-reductase
LENDLIVIAGAGTIGCYLGGLLQAAGAEVVFLGRARIAAELAEFGLTLTDRDGARAHLPGSAIRATTEVDVLARAALVLVTVKSGGTEEIGRALGSHAQPGTLVVSLQNGVGNVALLRSLAVNQEVVAGMVPFNVVHLGKGCFHRATAGALVIESGVPAIAERLRTTGLAVIEHPDMQAVAWGKLLINLNNALNALSGLPLAQQLAVRAWRRVLADCIDEGLSALSRAGITPAQAGPLAPRLLPFVMRLPDWLFRQVARAQLRIDPLARSSMWEDLERGRPTEIDYLQGAIVSLAREVGTAAPTNARIQALVHRAESAQRGSPRLDPAALGSESG